ncbi:MAG: hypothetical protein KDB37_18515 [Ilumatobacter sp.]|nr:hypothetical protein [Ilumatobacter sp.]
MAYRIVLERQPAPAVRLQIADLVGEEHIVDVGGRCTVVVPDQAAVAGVIPQLHDLGCRIAEMASGGDPDEPDDPVHPVHPDRV